MATEQDYWNQMYANACDQNEVLSLRQQLSAALAACKLKDEQLIRLQGALKNTYSLSPEGRVELTRLATAIAIKPDDSALKAWMGEPVAWLYSDACGSYYTDDKREWYDAHGIEEVVPLYAKPRSLK